MVIKKKATTVTSTPSEADILWDEIKNLPIGIYSLPNQRILDHVIRKSGTDDTVILGLRSSAVLPLLETVLGAQKQHRDKVSFKMKAEGENITEMFPKYTMTEMEQYVVISRYVPEPDREELQNHPEYFIANKDEK